MLMEQRRAARRDVETQREQIQEELGRDHHAHSTFTYLECASGNVVSDARAQYGDIQRHVNL